MQVKRSFFKLFPDTLDNTQIAVLGYLIGQIENPKDVLRVSDEDLEKDLKGGGNGIGRDAVQNTLKELHDKGYIFLVQDRNPKGQFALNEIQVKKVIS